jgi:hypothetical protein
MASSVNAAILAGEAGVSAVPRRWEDGKQDSGGRAVMRLDRLWGRYC